MLSRGGFSSRKKPVGVIVASILIVLFALLSVSGCKAKSASGPVAVKEMTIALGSDPGSVDPLRSAIASGQDWFPSQIYETLVIPDEKMKPAPLLAESWERADALTWKFHLRKGVNFQDGASCNAQAVKFSLERMQQEGPKWAVLPIKTITADDDYTVTIVTDKPFSPLVEYLMVPCTSIINPAAIATDKNALDSVSAGTGPFKLAEFVPHQKVVVVRNEDYWGAGPKLQKVTYKVITDANTRLMALQAGEVDAIRDVPLSEVAKLQADPKLRLEMTMGTRTTYYGFNTDRDYFKDIRIRQAFNLAIDRASLVKNILYDIGQPAKGFVTPTLPEYADLAGYAYDPAKARQFLADAGWKDGDGDGILEKDGKPFKIVLTTSTFATFLKPLAEAIQAQLKEVGVATEVRVVDTAASSDAVAKRNFDLTADASPARYGGADYQLVSRFHSTINPSIHARTGYVNARVDELLVQAQGEVDESKRLQEYMEIQQIIDREAAVIPLLYEMEVVATSSRVAGFKPHPAIWAVDLTAVDITAQ
jgi:peptide/nickel transport system substrate-binding protein